MPTYVICILAKFFAKHAPKDFSLLVKSYYFLSKHAKFEAEFPTDVSEPAPNNQLLM
jgi:hypothetical protein